MSDSLEIFVDQLRDGKSENIDALLSSEFLGVKEPGLTFAPDVTVHGKVYLAERELVIHLDMEAIAIIPCSICGDSVRYPVHIKSFYHVEPIANIKGRVFDLLELIRENLLLETPAFVECSEGNCPERNSLQKYFKKEDHSSLD